MRTCWRWALIWAVVTVVAVGGVAEGALPVGGVAWALPSTQSTAATDGDATVTLWVRDRAIDGDARTWCQVRVEVLGVGHALTAGDEVTVSVFEDDLVLNDLCFETTLTVTAAEAAAGLVDRTLDCSGSFYTGDIGLAVEIFAEASVSKATCGFLCFEDYPVTASLSVTVVDDDPFEEDDGFATATALSTGAFVDRVCRDADWWSFTVTEPSELTLDLVFEPSVGALTAAVLDATSLAAVATSTPDAGGASLDAVLAAGGYYLRVTPDAADDYNFYDYTVALAVAGCAPGQTEDRTCGDCGTETRSCQTGGTWGPFGACTGEGDCTPGDVEGRACDGGAEQRTCEPTCAWGVYGPCEGGCVSGGTERCYGGAAETEGVGVCVAGTRTCENGVWGNCEGAVLPSYELCSDGLDNDCDGWVDSADSSCATALPPPDGCGCHARGPAGLPGRRGGGGGAGPGLLLLLLALGGWLGRRRQGR